MLWSPDGFISRLGVQTIKFHDWESPLLNSQIRSADRRIRRFGVQTVKFNDLECMQTVECDNLMCSL